MRAFPLSLLFTVMLTTSTGGCDAPPTCDLATLELPDGVTLADLEASGRYALDLLNADRAHFAGESLNAAPLVWDDALFTAALCHAQDMCARGYYAHDTPEGLGPAERITAVSGKTLGEELWKIAENIAWRSRLETAPDTATLERFQRQTHLAYMDECQCHDGCAPDLQAGHRRNILNPSLTHVGIGTWYCPDDARLYQVEDFWREQLPGPDHDAYCPAGTTALPPDPLSTVTVDG